MSKSLELASKLGNLTLEISLKYMCLSGMTENSATATAHCIVSVEGEYAFSGSMRAYIDRIEEATYVNFNIVYGPTANVYPPSPAADVYPLSETDVKSCETFIGTLIAGALEHYDIEQTMFNILTVLRIYQNKGSCISFPEIEPLTAIYYRNGHYWHKEPNLKNTRIF